MVTVCPSQFATRRTLFHVLVGCGLLMLKVSRLKLPVIWLLVSMWLNTLTKSQIRSEERFSRNAETDLVCRLLLEKKNEGHDVDPGVRDDRHHHRDFLDAVLEEDLLGQTTCLRHRGVADALGAVG